MKTELLQLEWRTEKRKVSELVPYEYNPRKINEVRKEKLRSSLEKFNLVEIPVIDTENKLIAGHQRVFIMFDLGRGDEIIDVRVPNRQLTEEEFKEYNLISNIDYAEFDWEMIDKHFNDIDLEGIGMDLTEFDAFMDEQNISINEEEGDVDIELPVEPISQKNDVYEFVSKQKGLVHRLICADSTKSTTYKKLLQDLEIFNMIVTDPPYNVDYEGGTSKKLKIKNDKMKTKKFYEFLEGFFKNAFPKTMIGAPVYVFYSDAEAVNFRNAMTETGFKISSVLIWVKNQFVLGRLDYHMQHEPILVGEVPIKDSAEVKQHQPILYGWNSEGKHPWYSDRKQSSVLEFNKPHRNEEHPTMKPIDLIMYLIQNSSRQKDIVGDMFIGSGTTLIACEKSWRSCRAAEFDPKYVDVVIRRYVNYMRDNLLDFKIIRNGDDLTKDQLDEYLNQVTDTAN